MHPGIRILKTLFYLTEEELIKPKNKSKTLERPDLTPTCNFCKNMRGAWAPHLPVSEVTSSPAWHADCRGSRRRSAQNAPKTQSSKESFRNGASVYSSHARKQQNFGELTSHLSSKTGNGRSSIKCRRGSWRGVGRPVMKVVRWWRVIQLVLQYLGAAIPVAGMQATFITPVGRRKFYIVTSVPPLTFDGSGRYGAPCWCSFT